MRVICRGSPFFLVGACVIAGMSIGCTGTPPSGEVTGKITFEGNGVVEGVVSFQSENGTGGDGQLKTEGAYTIKALPVGEYNVTVHPLVVRENDPKTGVEAGIEKPAPDIPFKYRTVGTSDLKAKVETGKNVINFELKR